MNNVPIRHKCAYSSLKKRAPFYYNKSTANVVVLLDNFIPAVRVTTRTDERPSAHAITSENTARLSEFCTVPCGPIETGRRAPTERECHLRGRPLARPPALTLSGYTMRHLRTAWEPGMWGCPGVESSRDPWYTPAQVLPDLTRTVPNLIRGASRKCDEDENRKPI